MNEKEMTAEERAKYTWDYVGNNVSAGNENVIFIREQIKQAEQSAYERGLEDAAKVCDEHDKKDHWPTTYLGQRIRALKEVRQ